MPGRGALWLLPRRLPGTELFAPARISTESAASADRYVSLMLEELGVADVEVARAIAAWRRAYNLPVGVWGRADPDAGAALALARTAGLRAAVISNSNGAIRAILDGLGLTRHLDFVLDSSEVGVEKPDPRIFRSALERAGVRPEEAVYVGDLYSVDVLGAGAAGQSDRHCRDRGGLRAAARPSMSVGVCGAPEPVAPVSADAVLNAHHIDVSKLPLYHGHVRGRRAMRWKIGQAKQRFSEVLRRAAKEPQLICNRDRVVAAVIDAESAKRVLVIREKGSLPSIAEAFEGLRALAARERYALRTPSRKTRRNAFADGLDRLSR